MTLILLLFIFVEKIEEKMRVSRIKGKESLFDKKTGGLESGFENCKNSSPCSAKAKTVIYRAGRSGGF